TWPGAAGVSAIRIIRGIERDMDAPPVIDTAQGSLETRAVRDRQGRVRDTGVAICQGCGSCRRPLASRAWGAAATVSITTLPRYNSTRRRRWCEPERSGTVNESEWLAWRVPRTALEFLRGKVSERKCRLLACAYCRRRMHPNPDLNRRVWTALEASEQYA